MKQHKTIFTVATMLLMAGGLLASCSSDDLSSAPVPEGNGESKVYTLSISTQKGGDASNRVLAEDGEVIRSTWATTEKVYVKKGDSWFTGELQPQSAGKSTTLRGVLSGVDIAAGDVLTLQFPKKGDMNYDGQVGTLAGISDNFDWGVADVTVSSVDMFGNVTVNNIADFKKQQAILKLTLQDEEGNDINATQLKVTSGDKTFTVTPASATNVMYVAVPAGAGDITLFAVAGQNRYIGSIHSAPNGLFTSSTVVMNTPHQAGDIVDDGEYIKLYTSATGGYRIPKSDTSSSVTWVGNVQDSWGSKEQWQAIFTACGGNANSGYTVLNDKVSASGISGWTQMSDLYWSCSEDDSHNAWCFYDNGWDYNNGSYTGNVRSVSAF